MSKKAERIKSPSIEACVSAEDYLCAFNKVSNCGVAHTRFFHYTSVNNADAILSTEELRLTKLGSTSNDTREKEWYEKNGANLFSVCFSTGTSESLPLWYLYSGIDGKGVQLGFKSGQLRKLLKEPKLTLISTQSEKPYTEKERIVELKEEDYRLSVKDILYIGKDSGNSECFRIKHNGRTNNGVPKQTEEVLVREYGAFCKNLIWFYEKETRLQVEIINEKLRRHINNGENYAILLSLEELEYAFDVMLGPNFQPEEKIKLQQKSGFAKYAFAQIRDSEHCGQINMNLKERLCESCDKKLKKETEEHKR